MHRFKDLCTRQGHAFGKSSIKLYRNEHMKILQGAWVFIPMHRTGAQIKSLFRTLDMYTYFETAPDSFTASFHIAAMSRGRNNQGPVSPTPLE